MDYQEKSNAKIGVSGVGKKYIKMPWSIEDTIENLEELKVIMQQKLIITNYQGKGEKDAEEVAFDFDRAINALKENQDYHKLGTLEEVREAVEKQKAKKPLLGGNTDKLTGDIRICHCCCGIVGMDDMRADYCADCGQKLDWSEEENHEEM